MNPPSVLITSLSPRPFPFQACSSQPEVTEVSSMWRLSSTFPGFRRKSCSSWGELQDSIQLMQYANRCNAVVHRFKDEIRLLCSLNMSRVFQDFSFVGHKIKPLEAPLQNAGSLNPSRSTAASLSNGIKGRCNCRCCRLLTTWHLSFPAPTESSKIVLPRHYDSQQHLLRAAHQSTQRAWSKWPSVQRCVESER